MGYSRSYAEETRRLYAELGRAKAQAHLFRGLLSETDGRLRQAWAAGRLADGVIPVDLIGRTRAALAGEGATPMTMAEIVAEAADRLAAMTGAQP